MGDTTTTMLCAAGIDSPIGASAPKAADEAAAGRLVALLTGEDDPVVSWQVFCNHDKSRRGLVLVAFGWPMSML
jgi:hypothetical protein